MIEVDTPQSIYDDTDPHEDVFFQALDYAGFEGSQLADLDNALWDQYRYRMINSCSRDLWIQLLKDRARSLYTHYKPVLDLFDDTDMKDTSVSSFETNTLNETELLPDTPVDDVSYLSSRNKTKQDGKSYAGTAAEAFRGVADAMTDPYYNFTQEFSDLFLNRWR